MTAQLWVNLMNRPRTSNIATIEPATINEVAIAPPSFTTLPAGTPARLPPELTDSACFKPNFVRQQEMRPSPVVCSRSVPFPPQPIFDKTSSLPDLEVVNQPHAAGGLEVTGAREGGCGSWRPAVIDDPLLGSCSPAPCIRHRILRLLRLAKLLAMCGPGVCRGRAPWRAGRVSATASSRSPRAPARS